jgi:hypothetical protein
MRSVFSSPFDSSILVPLGGLLLLMATPLAHAEVFKCTGADGKTSYSQSPCAAADAKEEVVPIQKGPISNGPVRNWAAENAAANARVKAAADAAASNAEKASASAKSTQQGIAECEANHGVNCSSAEEIAKREASSRTPTPEEALQRAAAGRRAAESGVSQPEVKEQPKDKPPSQGSNGIATPVKTGT